MTNVNLIGQDLQFLLDEAGKAIESSNQALVLDYIYSNLVGVVEK